MIAVLDAMPPTEHQGTLLVTDREHADHDALVDAELDHWGFVLSSSGTYRIASVLPGERVWSWVLQPVRNAGAA